jgi:hypothetical protein
MIDVHQDHPDHQEVDEIGDSHEIGIEKEIEPVGVEVVHQEDHLGKKLGVMLRGLIWNDLIGFYSLGISVYVFHSSFSDSPS